MIMAEKKIELIETLECVNSCGLSRMTVGLSTDTLLGKEFTARLCSPECQDNCPNIFDLYIKLAAGDGLYLPHLCRLQTIQSRRLIFNPVEDTKPKDTTAWLQENGLSSSWTYYKEAPVDHDHAHDLAVPAASEPSGSTQSDSEKDWTSPAPAPVESKDASKPLPISPVPQIQQQPHSMPASSPNWASSLFEFIY
ncbi:hypothetical protein O6H91_18G011800 [Diphasiastrum complanatum]|uniref:Uncharacterized protein n=1 Tax=Diphasiastrum complanatum TaxID=34168 RepID=A0ACC2AY43_DIPCM|nr:hypothetical protein O6H91_18G011800 [Diphasiastrum complanatum]